MSDDVGDLIDVFGVALTLERSFVDVQLSARLFGGNAQRGGQYTDFLHASHITDGHATLAAQHQNFFRILTISMISFKGFRSATIMVSPH